MLSQKQTIRIWFTFGFIFGEYDYRVLEISLGWYSSAWSKHFSLVTRMDNSEASK